jgi:hypothetical protein
LLPEKQLAVKVDAFGLAAGPVLYLIHGVSFQEITTMSDDQLIDKHRT